MYIPYPLNIKISMLIAPNQRAAEAQQGHAQKPKKQAQVSIMTQIHALGKELQRHADHDTCRGGKQDGVKDAARSDAPACGELEPRGGKGGAERLREASERRGPGECARARL